VLHTAQIDAGSSRRVDVQYRHHVALPLKDRIVAAFEAGLKSDKFDGAVSALLSELFPWLLPVEAGEDLGC